MIVSWVWVWVACGAPEAPPTVEEAAPADVTAAPAPTTPAPPAAPADPTADWAPAWPIDAATAWVPAPGRLLTPRGLSPVTAGDPCGDGLRVAAQRPVAWFPGTADEVFSDPPAVMAATVERASWRLADVLGPPTGVVPGGRYDVDPALHEGITVRDVLKTRRPGGPPVLLIVGDRDGRVAIALTDRDAGTIHGSDVFELGGDAPWPVPHVTPAGDYDGDGGAEVVVWADDDGEGTRVVYRVDLGPRPGLWRLAEAKRPELPACP